MNKSRFHLIVLFFLVSIIISAEPSLNNNFSASFKKPRKMEFKVRGRLPAWDIKSVTYVGDRHMGYVMQIKGTATNDYSDKLSGIVRAGYYTKQKVERLTSLYIFPVVKRGESFDMDILFFLPAGYTPENIGGILFEDGIDYMRNIEKQKTLFKTE